MEYISQFGLDRPWDWPATKALYGAATLDGTRGSKLIAPLYVRDENGIVWEKVDRKVFTWRAGRLVAEKAPAAPKLTRSVWKHGAWVKLSTRTVSLKGSKAYPYLRYDGPPVLLGVASVDVDGNGKADEVRSYRYRDGRDRRYRVKVTTDSGKVVAAKLAAVFEDPMVGAAELDGVPGAEIVYFTFGDDHAWTVYTWRKNALVKEAAPAMCGNPPGGRWMGCSDESGIQFTFSMAVDGAHHVVALPVRAWDRHPVRRIRVAEREVGVRPPLVTDPHRGGTGRPQHRLHGRALHQALTRPRPRQSPHPRKVDTNRRVRRVCVHFAVGRVGWRS